MACRAGRSPLSVKNVSLTCGWQGIQSCQFLLALIRQLLPQFVEVVFPFLLRFSPVNITILCFNLWILCDRAKWPFHMVISLCIYVCSFSKLAGNMSSQFHNVAHCEKYIDDTSVNYQIHFSQSFMSVCSCITKAPRFSSSLPLLKQLPIDHHIKFKLSHLYGRYIDLFFR